MKVFKGQVELKGSYKLEVGNSYFIVDDDKGNLIYYENSDGYWYKREYDSKGNEIYYENSDGYWCKRVYDNKSNQILRGRKRSERD